jgi:hypothetical protein
MWGWESLLPRLALSVGLGAGLHSPTHRSHGTTVHDGSRPLNAVVAREPIERCKVDEIPSARLLPIAQASPARHPDAAAQFVWQHLPRGAAAKDKENAGQARSIRDARPSTVRSPCWNGKERFNQIAQCIREQRGADTRPRYRAATGRFSCRERAEDVLLCALKELR